jgi:hypothetical protein
MEELRRIWKRWSAIIIVVAAAFWTVLTAGVSGYWSVRQFKASSEQFQKDLDYKRETREIARTDAAKEAAAKSAAEQKIRDDAAADAANTRRIEAQKPFLEKRLDTYIEAIKVAGRLTDMDLPVDSDTWKENAKRFWEMRWGELEMVGDPGIRNAARLVAEEMSFTFKQPNEDRHNLRWSVECLADELRFSLEHTWGLQKGSMRETVLKQLVSKVPDGCNQGRDEPIRPPGMH